MSNDSCPCGVAVLTYRIAPAERRRAGIVAYVVSGVSAREARPTEEGYPGTEKLSLIEIGS